jgi:hypothetical protein
MVQTDVTVVPTQTREGRGKRKRKNKKKKKKDKERDGIEDFQCVVSMDWVTGVCHSVLIKDYRYLSIAINPSYTHRLIDTQGGRPR